MSENKICFSDESVQSPCGVDLYRTPYTFGTDSWPEVTCPECLAKQPVEIHYYETGTGRPGSGRTGCGQSLAVSHWSNDLSEVTCEACTRTVAKAAPGTPERHQQLIAECEALERRCREGEAFLAETRRGAESLRLRLQRHRLRQLSAPVAAQNGLPVPTATPGEFLRDLRGYAAAQREHVSREFPRDLRTQRVRPSLSDGDIPTWV